MSSTFPFLITEAPAEAHPAHCYTISADVSGLDDYYTLFKKYGFGGGASCWAEHIETILEEHEPGLLEHLEFDEQGETFLAYADSRAATDGFMQRILPLFGSLGALNKYLSQTDPEDFFE